MWTGCMHLRNTKHVRISRCSAASRRLSKGLRYVWSSSPLVGGREGRQAFGVFSASASTPALRSLDE